LSPDPLEELAGAVLPALFCLTLFACPLLPAGLPAGTPSGACALAAASLAAARPEASAAARAA
jgi:hypothetical protein